jgi:prevent-host-death family protein
MHATALIYEDEVSTRHHRLTSDSNDHGIMTMVITSVSKSRFKAHALAYFREVEQTGRELVITDRGAPVLKLVPYKPDPQAALRVLRDTVARYDAPTEPVEPEAWESAR